MQKAGGADSKFKKFFTSNNKAFTLRLCNYTTVLSEMIPLCLPCVLQSHAFLSAHWGGGIIIEPLSKPHEASQVLDLLSVCRRCVGIPESKRVVGLKPGFNSKTIQTNTPPPQPHPSWPSLPPLQTAIRSHRKLTLLALSTFFKFLFFKNNLPLKSEATRSRAKANILQGPSMVLLADDAAMSRPERAHVLSGLSEK